MITENLSTLKIHKLTQEQYDRELESGNLDPNALYLTPDKSEIPIPSEIDEGKFLRVVDGEAVWQVVPDSSQNAVQYAEVIGGYERSSANLNKGSVEYGFIETSNGLKATYETKSAVYDPNYVPVEGGATISWWIDADVAGANIYTYDADKNYLGYKYVAKYTGTQSYTLDSNVAYVRWSSWTTVPDITGLKVAVYYSEDAKAEYEEYAETAYYEKAIPSEQVKNEHGKTITEQIGHITPEMFGAFGDGAHDDATALSNCFAYARDNGNPVKGVNKYRIGETLVIDFDKFDISLNSLIYDGAGFAIEFNSCSNGVAEINEITANSGNGVLISSSSAICEHNAFIFGTITASNICVKMLADGNGVQHNQISFQKLKASEACIHFEILQNASWITECQWTGGRFCGLLSSANVKCAISAVGIIDPDTGNHRLTTQKFWSVAFEGVVVGCYMENVHGFIFNHPRTSEAITDKVFRMVGDCRACQFYLGWFYLSHLDYSGVIAPSSGNNFHGNFVGDSGASFDFSEFTIRGNGEMVNVNQTIFGYRNLTGVGGLTLTLDPADFRTYIANKLLCGTGMGAVTLDARYYNAYNINTIYAIVGTATSGDALLSSDGTLNLDLTNYQNKTLRLTKTHTDVAEFDTGWVIEELGGVAAALEVIENGYY